MHHGILLKVKGSSKAKAEDQANLIMDDTMRCGTCEQSVHGVNWDYYELVGEYTVDFIKENRPDLFNEGIDTVEKAVKHYINDRKAQVKDLSEKVKEELVRFTDEIEETKKIPTYPMLAFYLGELERIQNVIELENVDEGLYTLHCTNNHYADMTEYTSGTKEFYFWYDRHF